jgi:hypothetical protein
MPKISDFSNKDGIRQISKRDEQFSSSCPYFLEKI